MRPTVEYDQKEIDFYTHNANLAYRLEVLEYKLGIFYSKDTIGWGQFEDDTNRQNNYTQYDQDGNIIHSIGRDIIVDLFNNANNKTNSSSSWGYRDKSDYFKDKKDPNNTNKKYQGIEAYKNDDLTMIYVILAGLGFIILAATTIACIRQRNFLR